MIIVSQDKKQIINFETINFIDIMPMDDGRFEIDANFAHCITELGYYETEERAKEVLQEISEQYEYTETIKIERAALRVYDNFIYRMPKE